MKKIIINIVITSIILVIYRFYAFPQSSEKHKNDKSFHLNMFNSGEDDFIKYYSPFLPGTDFFIQRNYYSSGNVMPDNNYSILNVLEKSTHMNNQDNKYTSIIFNSIDASGKFYFLDFTFSEGYRSDTLKSAAVSFTIDTFLKTRDNDIESVLTEKIIQSGSIDNLNIMYANEQEPDQITGYTFTYKIERSPRYRAARTAGQILFANALGVGNYFLYKHENMVDWQYDYSWHDSKQKVKDGWYWDPNNFNTNTIYHLYAGVAYYQIARSNYYNIWESLAWTFAGSFFWEFIGEWREQVSLNDMIFTPTLGAVTGEALLQTSFFIEKNMKPGILREILYFTLNPFGWLNKKLDSGNSGDVRVQILFANPLQMTIEKFDTYLHSQEYLFKARTF